DAGCGGAAAGHRCAAGPAAPAGDVGGPPGRADLARRRAGGGAPVSGPSFEEVLRRRRVLVCVGAGGVGKTTLAAAVAMRAAALGRSALVCTIDPARRLANALGLTWLGNAPTEVSTEVLAGAGIRLAAPLQAMMLDLKASWDELIQRQAPP